MTDLSSRPSIVSGTPLAQEAGLGALTLGGYLGELAERFGPREALVMRDADGTTRWNFAELWERSHEVARALIACGVVKGTRVGILSTNRLELMSSLFGTALAGGVATMLSTFSTAPELEYLLAKGACSVLLLERRVLAKDFAEMLCGIEPALRKPAPGALHLPRLPYLRHLAVIDSDEGLGAIRGWSDFLKAGETVPPELVAETAAGVAPSDPGALFFSSGSTGKPKGILSSHRGVCIQLWRYSSIFGFGDGVRCWPANGFVWSGGFVQAIGGTLSVGGTIVLQRVFDAAEALDLMVAERVNYPIAWPHQWAQLEVVPGFAEADLSAMRYVGRQTPIGKHPKVRSDWYEPLRIYGNTETFTISTGVLGGASDAGYGDTSGPPLPGNTIRIVYPDSGETVPWGTSGEIAVKGPTLMMGYVGVPLDESLDEMGFFRTGDGGFLDPAGRLVWQGRMNDIIKTGGANVAPIEVDTVIRTMPGVKACQTVGVPDDALGELVVTCLVPHDDAALSETAVRDFARAQLASYKCPRRVLFFAESDLELTGNAKIKAGDLRDLAVARLAG